MNKVLGLCFFPAFVPPSNGGQSRLFNFYRALSRRHEITLLTSTYVGVEEEVIQHGTNFIERRIPKDDHYVRQYVELERLSSGGDLSGPAVAACRSLPTKLHQAYLEEYRNAESLIFDDPFTACCDLFAGTDNKPRIYHSYNCESELYAELHPSDASRPIRDLVRSAEMRILKNADLVLYCNETDLTAFREMVPDTTFEALYTPNGMTPVAASRRTWSSNGGALRAVFVGSGHLPNVRAADFIARKVAPRLPEITFDIIGSCLSEGSYPANLHRHGVVDDVEKMVILSGADVALNPMAEGGGSNVKVLEYFSFSLPVLSTSFGMRGIQAEAGREYLEVSFENFVQSLRGVAADAAALKAIGTSGNALALRSYTWETILQPVAERVESLVNSRAAKDLEYFVLVLNDYDSFWRIGGGSIRTRGLYEAVQHWCPVVFVSFSQDGALSARKHDEGITVINVPMTEEHVADLSRVNARSHVDAGDILASRHCCVNPWLRMIYYTLRLSARCIVVEHCYMARLPLAWRDRFVYSSQNNETELKKSILSGHPLKSELLSEVDHIERVAVECSAATIAVSQESAEDLVKGKRAAGPIIVVRNGAAMPAASESVERARGSIQRKFGKRDVVFLGSAHSPNVDAAHFIVKRLAPKCPDVRFHLLGSVCSAVLQVPTNVKLWGVVDEVRKSAVMQSCVLALNPMSTGSGSNVKLADYLANGLFTISTDFGQRGYPDSVKEHVNTVPLEKFPEAIRRMIDEPTLCSITEKTKRCALFERDLSMRRIAQRFIETLDALGQSKKRVLFVTYRYTDPALGGAEVFIEKIVRALGESSEYDVDVVAPEISEIHSHFRFSEEYSFEQELGAPVDIPNVRFGRFPADPLDRKTIHSQLRKAWAAQPNFEQAVDRSLYTYYRETGLSWGWGNPDGDHACTTRWSYTECGIFLFEAARVDLEGYAPDEIVTIAYSSGQAIGGPWTLKDQFSLTFQAEAGEVRFVTSCPQRQSDPRPLGFRLSRLTIDGRALDLSAATLLETYLSSLSAVQNFRLLDQAAKLSRNAMGVRLTDGRGPWSRSLEHFIANHVADYDLVVTHNNVFRPAVVAIDAAKKQGVPSILIPHAHLDDDFYHFPDCLDSARNATLVLAAPKAACKFLGQKGCNVRYLPAGCDADEKFTQQDGEAFRKLHPSPRPFILVLGRKAMGKGYRQVIEAVEQLNRNGLDLQVVLIGPDDDGVAVNSPNAVYLGRQPRQVVRGALQSCLAVCNMSSSESFGVVLLEAWLAGKPVIANENCAAFRDIAVDEENSLLVDPRMTGNAIRKLLAHPDLGARLGREGKRKAVWFDWRSVQERFVKTCTALTRTKSGEEE